MKGTRVAIASLAALSLSVSMPIHAEFWDKLKEQSDKARDAIESLGETASKLEDSLGIKRSYDAQEKIGSPADGVSSESIQENLVYQNTEPNTLAIGYDREQVLEVQWYLNMLGYNVGKRDGIYGPDTRSGVISYQRDKGLVVDGELSDKLRSHFVREALLQVNN